MPHPFVLGSALTAGAGILGGFLGYKGQQDANRQNIALAREQMAFQERMSNTAVTRRMADLKNAGINPILAGKYDASSPAGALATVGNVGAAGVQGVADSVGAITSALSLKKMYAETKLLDKQVEKTGAEIGQIDEQTRLIGRQIGLTDAQIKRVGAETALAEANTGVANEMARKIIQEARVHATAADKARWELGLQQALYEGKLGRVLWFIKELAVPIAALGVGGLLSRKPKPQKEPYRKYETGPSDRWRNRWNPNIPETN